MTSAVSPEKDSNGLVDELRKSEDARHADPRAENEYTDLLVQIESPSFTVFDCLGLLARHANNIGVHFLLCQRLNTFPQSKIEFFLPQLVHIVVSYETESAALEDFLVQLCQKSTHCTLIIFWQIQASLSDLEESPQSYGFSVAKRLHNKIQGMLFSPSSQDQDHIRDNTQPGLVLASMVASACAVPELARYIRPLVVSQGRKQRSNFLRVASKVKRNIFPAQVTSVLGQNEHDNSPEAEILSSRVMAASMPDLTRPSEPKSEYDGATRRMSGDFGQTPGQDQLRTNYFRCETQFVYSLQSIANRLVRVPAAARLSSLQFELALLNRDLPAEVDIPFLIPGGRNGNQNRIVRISPTEATVLNSAEKVPYLLLVEYLKGDLSFNPSSERNRHLLANNGQKRYLFDRKFEHTPVDPGTPRIESTFANEEQDLGSTTPADREGVASASVSTVSLVPLPGAEAPLTAEEAAGATGSHEPPVDDTKAIGDLASQMHTASIILSQLDGAESSKLPKGDIAAIKARIVESMQAMQDHHILARGEAGDRKLENDLKTAGLTSSDDPSAANLAEDWTERKNRIRRSSPYGQYPTWDLFSVIVKTGDDLRQEALACQMIMRAQQIWGEENVNVWVKQMRILITSSNSGLVETITNGLSVHSIKKALTGAQDKDGQPQTVATLAQHFAAKFGDPSGSRYRLALRNFVRSLAPYSLLTYLLQIKDRHNGNILLDNEGHIIHIDFGFMLSNSPGGRFDLESVPFKLTNEYVELMGGRNSQAFQEFVSLLTAAFKSLRKHAEEFVSFVDIMAKDSKLPCFQNGPATAMQLLQRFHTDLSDAELENFVEHNLVYKSVGSVYTRCYDQFQMMTQGIYS